MKVKTKKDYRVRRHLRIRKRVSGTAERPRMAISKSTRSLTVQFIDDERGVTLAGVSTAGNGGAKNVAAATELGRRAAELALSRGIRRMVVDRGGFRYHGRIKALVEAVCAAGLRCTAAGDEARSEGGKEEQ